MVQPKAVAMRAQSRSPKQPGENPYQSARQGVPSILLSSSEATAGSLCRVSLAGRPENANIHAKLAIVRGIPALGKYRELGGGDDEQ